ncbi:MAG: hypothetical protein MRZ79_13995 [Bacteroidia bacterium]|nr:hypothetical protein [Bacteroidia bacterium]
MSNKKQELIQKLADDLEGTIEVVLELSKHDEKMHERFLHQKGMLNDLKDPDVIIADLARVLRRLGKDLDGVEGEVLGHIFISRNRIRIAISRLIKELDI